MKGITRESMYMKDSAFCIACKKTHTPLLIVLLDDIINSKY